MGAFGLGLPSLSLGSGNGAGFNFTDSWSETPAGSAVPVIPSPGVRVGSWGDVISSGISTGLSAWKTKLQYDLLDKQINKGQVPSIVSGPNGTPSAGFSTSTVYDKNGHPISTTYSAGSSIAGIASGFSSSTFLIIGALLLLLLLFKR